MDLDRAVLKATLLEQRKQMRQWQGRLVYLCQCDLCGRPYPTDLHESIVSRRPSQMNADLQYRVLTSPCNLNLLCNRCNRDLAGMERWRRHLVSRNIMRYGKASQTAEGRICYDPEPIISWLATLPMTNVSEYTALVEDVARELNAPPRKDAKIAGAPNKSLKARAKTSRKRKEKV